VASGDRVLPLYSLDGDPLYFRVDGNVYLQGEKGRDDFTSGETNIDVLDIKDVDGEYEYTGGMIWDATRDAWDTEALRDVTSWHRVSIQEDSAFKDCKNLVCFTAKNEPVLDTETTEGFFENCELFNCQLDKWDFSNITSSDRMFDGCVSFEEEKFYYTLLKMHRDKNDAVSPDNNQNIGALGVEVRHQITLDLIEAMALVGQIVLGFVDKTGEEIPYNSSIEFSTIDYTYAGNFVV